MRDSANVDGSIGEFSSGGWIGLLNSSTVATMGKPRPVVKGNPGFRLTKLTPGNFSPGGGGGEEEGMISCLINGMVATGVGLVDT